MASRGSRLQFGLALLAEQGWSQSLSTDGGEARCMLTILALHLGALGLSLLGFP
jgi:hypothetical protein